MRALFHLFFIVFSIIYPFAVYFGRDVLSPIVMATILLCVLACRAWLMGWAKPMAKLSIWVGLLVFVMTFSSGSEKGLLWYPVVVNLMMLLFFSYGLFYPPTVIEQFARAHDPHFSEKAVFYTRRVTQVWCVFFIVNAIVAAWTASFSTKAIWALYNGLIAYVLMGTLFVGEWVVRYFYRRRHAI